MSFAVVFSLLARYQGDVWRRGLGEQMFDFAKLLLFVSFGYALICLLRELRCRHWRVVQQP